LIFSYFGHRLITTYSIALVVIIQQWELRSIEFFKNFVYSHFLWSPAYSWEKKIVEANIFDLDMVLCMNRKDCYNARLVTGSDKGVSSMRVFLAALVLCACSIAFCDEAQTWRLGKDQKWQQVSNDEQGRYALAVSRIKELIGTGQERDAQKALTNLKKDFPALAGRDLDAFITADLLYGKGKFTDSIPAFDKFMDDYPTSQLYQAALDREFQMGTALLAGYKVPLLKIFRVKGYDEGVKVMTRLADRAGDAPIAQQALLAVAKSYEKRKMWRDAFDTWADISSRWPTGQIGKEALLAMATTMYAGYRGPQYDATGLISAKGYYQSYKSRYPEDAVKIGVDAILATIEEQIAYKQYFIGKYYQHVGEKTGAVLYYDQVVSNWAQTEAGKIVQVRQKEALAMRQEDITQKNTFWMSKWFKE
jgi:outer membrane protein assembly factor BamD (BamD/ComL family)